MRTGGQQEVKFQPPPKRGLFHNEGRNLATYVASAKEIATYMLRVGEAQITLDNKQYTVSFRPWMTEQELWEWREVARYKFFWIRCQLVTVAALVPLLGAVEDAFGKVVRVLSAYKDQSSPDLVNIRFDLESAARLRYKRYLVVDLGNDGQHFHSEDDPDCPKRKETSYADKVKGKDSNQAGKVKDREKGKTKTPSPAGEKAKDGEKEKSPPKNPTNGKNPLPPEPEHEEGNGKGNGNERVDIPKKDQGNMTTVSEEGEKDQNMRNSGGQPVVPEQDSHMDVKGVGREMKGLTEEEKGKSEEEAWDGMDEDKWAGGEKRKKEEEEPEEELEDLVEKLQREDSTEDEEDEVDTGKDEMEEEKDDSGVDKALQWEHSFSLSEDEEDVEEEEVEGVMIRLMVMTDGPNPVNVYDNATYGMSTPGKDLEGVTTSRQLPGISSPEEEFADCREVISTSDREESADRMPGKIG
ncbi:hypothetical protein CBR_g48445 [Chara braunii]|uniref:DUF4283 domain-containing protein n=1 Tax=Chara braunii TaxID=69332 RepID=A0A388M2Z1_CHABU|nr:hypothetical protein CBR_g48445 [Chara braunii]|eukprot:GBG88833.1 hypothetical protein CBR_g48445 [Chara braunii]